MQQSAARLLAAVAVACLALAPSAYAQGTSDSGSGSGSGAMPSCAAKLVPCAGYLNSTSTAARRGGVRRAAPGRGGQRDGVPVLHAAQQGRAAGVRRGARAGPGPR